MSTANILALPSHVDASLVRPYPFTFGASTKRDPFREFVPKVHTWPAIFYAPGALHGGGSAWIPRRAQDLRAIALDTDHFSNEGSSPFAHMVGEDWLLIPSDTDPPAHRLYRSFVTPLFTPKAIGALEERVRSYARLHLSEIADRGECEFMSDFAFTFPIEVFLELMGLPQTETAIFLKWVTGLLHAPDTATIVDTTKEVVAYLRSVIDDRKRRPVDDLVSYGVRAEIEGRKLSDDELLGFCFNLFVGGLDTVSANMGLHFLHLARYPDDQRALRERPELIPAAIDELMRAYAAVTVWRTCKESVRYGDVTFMPGDKIGLSTTLAGRDPGEYGNPNEVMLDRKPRHISFSYGPHACVGLHLARQEMRVALEEFLAAIPQFMIRTGADIELLLHGTIQPTGLPLQWATTSQ